jgi:hypothetical protein
MMFVVLSGNTPGSKGWLNQVPNMMWVTLSGNIPGSKGWLK